jgi:hypothetical protein
MCISCRAKLRAHVSGGSGPRRFAATREGLLLLLLAAAGATLFAQPARQPERRAVVLYAGLVAALAAVASVVVPVTAR